MSNRRKPKGTKHTEGLNGTPLELQKVEWSDLPPARYSPTTLGWISGKLDEVGQLNVWECDACGEKVVTKDRHPGVTPSSIHHKSFVPNTECKGVCRSHFYNQGDAYATLEADPDRLTHEWYRPNIYQLNDGSPEVFMHVLQGGLLVRPLV